MSAHRNPFNTRSCKSGSPAQSTGQIPIISFAINGSLGHIRHQSRHAATAALNHPATLLNNPSLRSYVRLINRLHCPAAPRSHVPRASASKRTRRIVFRSKCGPLLHRLVTNILFDHESLRQTVEHGLSSNSCPRNHISPDVNYVALRLGISTLYKSA